MVSLPTGPPDKPKAYKSLKMALEEFCTGRGWPLFSEQVFHEKRKWRFDWLIPGPRPLVIEYEGIFSNVNGQNGHTGHKHFVKDAEKYNAAAIAGITVIRYTARNYNTILEDLNKFYNAWNI
jgi:hypothetical protein